MLLKAMKILNAYILNSFNPELQLNDTESTGSSGDKISFSVPKDRKLR